MTGRGWLIGCIATVVALAGGAAAIDLTGAAGAATAATSPAPSSLFGGQTLASGATLSSPDGRYLAEMTPAGALVVSIANPYGTPRPIWSTPTGSDTGAVLSLPADGDLSVLDTAGNPVWGVNATTNGCANLDMQSDGNLVLYGPGGAYWASDTVQHSMQAGDELLPGQVIFGGSDYELTMNPAGYLEVVDSAGVLWQSPGSVPGSYARVTGPGNFEVISPTGAYEWTAPVKTAVAGDVVTVGANGALAVVDPSGTNEWDPGIGETRSGLTVLNGPRAYQTCPAAPPAPAPTPTVVTTTTTTTTAPATTTPTTPRPTSPVALRVGIELVWRHDDRVSWVKSARVTRFPEGATLHITCRGAHGCPTRTQRRDGHRRLVHRTLSTGRRRLHHTLQALMRLRFHAGDRVIFTVTEPGHRPVGAEAIIRTGRPPLQRQLHLKRSRLGG